MNTFFEGNTAGSGGDLRLAGKTSLEGCDFVEKTSDEDEGPAVYNEGSISSISECSFEFNAFNCEPNYFFAYDEVRFITTRALRPTHIADVELLDAPISRGNLGST